MVYDRTEDAKAIEQVLERENDALTGGSESDSHTSDQEERAIDLQRLG